MMMTHPVPAPRTPKGREVARSTLEAASVAENKHDLSRLERILMASRNEDLNLTALINAVERDIWYMEQLESNPSVLRRKDSPTGNFFFYARWRHTTPQCQKISNYVQKIQFSEKFKIRNLNF